MSIQNYNDALRYLCNLLKIDATTLKRIGRSPKGLSKFDYISEILPNIDRFAITEKADGVRGMIIIKNNIAYAIIGDEFKKINVISTVDCIIECEVVGDLILLFDLLEYRGNNVSYKPFQQRYSLLKNIQIQSNEFTFKVKIFYNLTLSTYQRDIVKLYKGSKYSYKIDGIVFTTIHDNYKKTSHYKWKPPEQLTIDFLHVDGNLYNGITKQLFNCMGLSKDHILHIKNEEFFPVKFMPSLCPEAYSKKINNCKSKNWDIIELSYKEDEWVFHRSRDDRKKDLDSGFYYGNSFEVAELTFSSILNPLLFSDLIKSIYELTPGFYFEKSDESYKPIRKYNNYVKTELINMYRSKKFLIDMASGKGQDLKRYMDCNISNLLMIEIDKSAIDEIINRKYSIFKKAQCNQELKQNGMALTVINTDLTLSYKKNIKIITDINKITLPKFEKNKVPVIICNMALHYLIETPDKLNNITAFIDYWLEKGGEFLFTALNAQKINNLLKNTTEWVTGDGLYKINKTDVPNKIKILLPCSREMRDEYLINLQDLDKSFLKYNIIRIETGEFNKYIENSPITLNDEQIQFISLYQYSIYRKNDTAMKPLKSDK